MVTELTASEYESTMGGKMTDVTETAEPVVDIWPYVELLAERGIVSDYVVKNGLVEYVYRNSDSSFEHVLLPTNRANQFIVLIVDLLHRKITGHHILDLDALYNKADLP